MSEEVEPALDVRGLVKTFSGVLALRGADLSIRPGEIHGLIGQNGSGKSTLIKILSGFHAPDRGEVRVHGDVLHLPVRPADAARHRLSFMHQELSLAGGMSVLENLRLGRFKTGLGWKIHWKEESARVSQMLAEFGIDVDPHIAVDKLPQAERALVGFLRAYHQLDGERGLLVLDEPTSSLPRPAVSRLFDAMRVVRRHGTAVLFVSHRIEEVMEITDRVTVLRDGASVGTLVTRDSSEDRLVALLLGAELGRMYPTRVKASDRAVMTVNHIRGSVVRDFSLELHRGEIVGATGLVGMGHDEIPYLMYGAQPLLGGRMLIGGEDMGVPTPSRMRGHGVCLVPADRARSSGVPRATLMENVTLPALGQFFHRGYVHHGRERSFVQALLGRFDVRPAEPAALLGTLSGGNQQKTLLAKWLQLQPRVLLLHEPTQGVDIGARRDIFAVLREIAASGTAIFIASAEYEDLANICHAVAVLRSGRLVTWLRGEDLTEQRIAEQCFRPVGESGGAGPGHDEEEE